MLRARGVAIVVAGSVGLASASPLRLDVHGDACDFSGLDTQVRQAAAGDPVLPNERAAIRIELLKSADAFEAHIVFDDGNGGVRGPRVVTATTCGELGEAVAVVVAIALPGLATSPQPVSVSTPPNPARSQLAIADRTSDSLVAHVVIREPARPIETDVLVAGAGDVASQSVVGQLLIGLRLRRGATSLEGELRLDAPSERLLKGMGTIGMFRTQASISPCLHVTSFAACGVLSAGTVRGSGIGLTEARTVYTPLVSAGFRLAWERSITERMAVRLYGEIDTVLTTTTFDVDNMPVWTSPRLEGSLGIGFLAHLP